MSAILAILFFAIFGIAWPYWIAGRTRGFVTTMCFTMPVIAFFWGHFAK